MVPFPENWNKMTPDQKRTMRFDYWVRGEDLEFAGPEAKARYTQRATIIRDAVELKKIPARVPVMAQGAGYALKRAGLKQKSSMYQDWEKAAEAVINFCTDFQPDTSSLLFLMSGPSMELMGVKNMKWAGCGLPDDVQYQFVEQEFMKGDEYDHFLRDPSDFILRVYIPRSHGSLGGFAKLPQFSTAGPGLGGFNMPFLDPEVWKAFETVKKSAELNLVPLSIMMNASKKVRELGFPDIFAGFGAAPFDMLGDSLRGTRGVSLDILRRPKNVTAACEKLLELTPLPEVPLGTSPLIIMPLHKGSDEFMSRDQYERFYWPTFKQVMLNMINEGLVPAPFAEGRYNQRLDYISQMPKGTTFWYFDRTDMHKAKDVLGDVCCIMGNVPITTIVTGTPEEVKVCCKDLIDYCGKGGGYIVSPGTQLDHGQEETIKAMIDFTKEYGVYH